LITLIILAHSFVSGCTSRSSGRFSVEGFIEADDRERAGGVVDALVA
jgi:hypothetical protein